jgi:hypothetical protein
MAKEFSDSTKNFSKLPEKKKETNEDYTDVVANTFQKNTTITENIEDGDLTINVKSTQGFDPNGGTLLIRGGDAFEYVNYTGKTLTTFTGLTRAQSGATIDVEDIEVGQAIGTVASITGLQVGQRVVHPSFPQNTYVVKITAIPETSSAFIEFNTSPTSTGVDDVISDVLFVPMSSTVGLDFTASLTNPVSVEPAFPTYSASISHWGTAVIMDGSFNDDKNLIYTFSQSEKKTIPASKTITGRTGTGTLGATTFTVNTATDIVTGMNVSSSGIVQANTVVTDINGEVITISQPLVATMTAGTSVVFSGGNTKALFSIRLAPSVDTGIAANFGQRELINRMQLQLDSVGVLTSTPDSNLVVTAIMNGRPSSDTLWRNAVKDSVVVSNTSLAQIADYAGNNNKTIILGGEITGGFYVQGTSSIDLEDVRDLGNSILGGGESFANTNVYPDGPDVLSIVVTNLSDVNVDVLGRLSWSEAQA